MGLKPAFRLVANGGDITPLISDRLVSLSLSDSVGFESDLLEITLADDEPDNPIQIPATGAELELYLGYDAITQRMGLFICDEVELSGWPGTMTIRARSATYDKSKGGKTDLQTQKSRSWTSGTLFGDMIKRIANEHGMESAVSASMAKIPIPHTDQADESDINLLLRIAKKYDGIVKPSGGKITVTKRGEGKTASGEDLPVITVTPQDCVAYRLTRQKRENAGTVVAYYQLTKSAALYEVKVGEGEPVKKIGKHYPSQSVALAAAKAELAKRKRNQTTFSITLPGDPTISAECKLLPIGFREGIDGEWLITRADHHLSESGYTCDIEMSEPNQEDEPEVQIIQKKKPKESDPPEDDGPGHVIEEK